MKLGISSKFILSALLVACLFTSCSVPKNVAYLQGAQNAEIFEIASSQNSMIKVRPYDKMSIIVTCKDPVLAQMFNLPVYSNGHVQRSSATGGNLREYNLAYNDGISAYTVSSAGTIDFPVLGELKIEGMTRSEVAGFIKGELMGRGLIKDPIVTVEFLNVGISVLGDVREPGRYDLNVDQLTIIEAISLAGDLTIQGQRENIKVIRKEGDKVQTYLVDLTNPEALVKSPAYFLAQGDIVYVEPNDIRKRQTIANGNSVTNISFWISVASLLTSAAILFKK
ncbi:MAG: polysaccharide biosynthesis/export family protein [Muribaculaceae bacterium]|nr:polysaccharide biosynthesis/export family protein [Muribaculaceae bacterium]